MEFFKNLNINLEDFDYIFFSFPNRLEFLKLISSIYFSELIKNKKPIGIIVSNTYLKDIIEILKNAMELKTFDFSIYKDKKDDNQIHFYLFLPKLKRSLDELVEEYYEAFLERFPNINIGIKEIDDFHSKVRPTKEEIKKDLISIAKKFKKENICLACKYSTPNPFPLFSHILTIRECKLGLFPKNNMCDKFEEFDELKE